LSEGDVLVPKIANVKVVAEPSDTAKMSATGWVKIVLVQKR
jgi:hypothetical protein